MKRIAQFAVGLLAVLSVGGCYRPEYYFEADYFLASTFQKGNLRAWKSDTQTTIRWRGVSWDIDAYDHDRVLRTTIPSERAELYWSGLADADVLNVSDLDPVVWATDGSFWDVTVRLAGAENSFSIYYAPTENTPEAEAILDWIGWLSSAAHNCSDDPC